MPETGAIMQVVAAYRRWVLAAVMAVAGLVAAPGGLLACATPESKPAPATKVCCKMARPVAAPCACCGASARTPAEMTRSAVAIAAPVQLGLPVLESDTAGCVCAADESEPADRSRSETTASPTTEAQDAVQAPLWPACRPTTFARADSPLHGGWPGVPILRQTSRLLF